MHRRSAENVKVLIISYTFPPQSGVGGRRWAKFAKYFHRANIPVRILAAEPQDHESIWQSDIEDFKQAIRFVPSPIGAILRKMPSTIMEKVAYRLILAVLKLSQKGNYYDWSVRWSNYLMPHIEQAIQEGYTIIIASGGPFSYLHDLTSLRDRYGNSIHLVADFRDPWTTNKTAFGYDQISAERLAFEQQKEREVVHRFDAVVGVAEDMTTHFLSLAGDQHTRCQTIINGFDPDELSKADQLTQAGAVRFVFVGTLYDRTFRHVKNLVAVLERMESTQRLRYQFDFCGSMSVEAEGILRKIPEVKIHGKLPRTEAHELLRNASVAMLFLTDDLTYSLSTKFCEYIAMELPIWIISKDGSSPELISSNHLGIHSQPSQESIRNGLQFWLRPGWRDRLNGYETFDKTSYNIEKLSKDYLQLLTKII